MKIKVLLILTLVTLIFFSCSTSVNDKAKIQKAILDSIKKSDSIKNVLKVDSLKKDSLAKIDEKKINETQKQITNQSGQDEKGTKQNEVLKLNFIKKGNDCYLSVNTKKFLVSQGCNDLQNVTAGNATTPASCSVFGATGGSTTWTAKLNYAGDIIIDEAFVSTRYGSDQKVLRTIKKGEY